MDARQITQAFDDIFDQALVFHGFTDGTRTVPMEFTDHPAWAVNLTKP